MKHNNSLLVKVIAAIMALCLALTAAISVVLFAFEKSDISNIILSIALICIGSLFSACPILIEKAIGARDVGPDSRKS